MCAVLHTKTYVSMYHYFPIPTSYGVIVYQFSDLYSHRPIWLVKSIYFKQFFNLTRNSFKVCSIHSKKDCKKHILWRNAC